MEIKYSRDAISPFVVMQPLYNDGHVHRLDMPWKAQSSPFVINRYHVDQMSAFDSIEQLEDHYLSHAVPMRQREENLSTFCLNAQASVQASRTRRGIGWVVLLHPEMFERIRYFPERSIAGAKQALVSQFIKLSGDDRLRVGRWTLVANEDYRQLHVWTAEHLRRDTITTIYRGGQPTNKVDGLVATMHEGRFFGTPMQSDHYTTGEYIHYTSWPLIEP